MASGHTLEGLTLAGFKEGAAEERFQIELAKVIANYLDPNTSVKDLRKITVEFKFKAMSDDGQVIATSVTAKSTLASLAPATEFAVLQEDKKGQMHLVPMAGSKPHEDPRQVKIEGAENVTDIKTGRGGDA